MKKYTIEEAKTIIHREKHKRIYAINDSGSQAIIIFNPKTKSIMMSTGSERFEDGWMIHNTAHTFFELYKDDCLDHHVLVYTDHNGDELEFSMWDQFVMISQLREQRWTLESAALRLKRKVQDYHKARDQEVQEFVKQVNSGIYAKSDVLAVLNHYKEDLREDDDQWKHTH